VRIRSIKPEFWRSDDIASLSLADRLLFIGLWSYVDDSGVGVDRLALICADLFAADLERDPPEVYGRVTGGLQELSRRGLITRYEVDGKPFLHVTTWGSHQRIEKPSKPRYPLPTSENALLREHSGNPPVALPEEGAPGAGEQGSRGAGKNTPSPAAEPLPLDAVTPDGATQRDPHPEPKSDPQPTKPSRPADPPAFQAFWDAYPRKVGKDDARKVWARRTRTTAPDVITEGARRLAADPNLPDDKQFIPHPATWLARGGWDDEPLPPRSRSDRLTIVERNNATVPEGANFFDHRTA